MALELMLAGLGEAAIRDVAAVKAALPTPHGASMAASIANKFLARSSAQQAKATAALNKLATIKNRPPTNRTAAAAAAAHDQFIAAATAAGRLSVAGNLLGSASVLHANAAAAAINARTLPQPPGSPSPATAPAQAAVAMVAGAAAAISSPANTGVPLSLPGIAAAIKQSAAPIAAAVAAAPPGTFTSGARPYAPIAAQPTAARGNGLPSRFMVPPGITAQVFGRMAGVGTAIPAGLAPYKGGARAPTTGSNVLSRAQGYAAWSQAPNPAFYHAQRGAPVGVVASFEGGGLSGLGDFSGGGLGELGDSAQRIVGTTLGSIHAKAQAAMHRSLSGLGDDASDNALIDIAQGLLKRIGVTDAAPTWIQDPQNGGQVVQFQRSSDASRYTVVVDPVAKVTRARGGPIFPGSPQYGVAPYDKGSSPTPAQLTQALKNTGGLHTGGPTGTAPTHGQTATTPSHGGSANSGGSSSNSGGGYGLDSKATPTHGQTASGSGFWTGLSLPKKLGIGAGGALATIIGLKFLL